MPVFAESILHGGARTLGVLMGCSGVGALTGALTLATRTGVRGLGRPALLLVPVGGSMMVQMAASNTLIQSMVPDTLRGRVMAVYSMMFMGMAPFGALWAGSVAEKIGAPYTVASGGVVSLVTATVSGSRLPVLRVEARRLIVAQGLVGGDPPAEVTGPSQEVVLRPEAPGPTPASGA